MTTTFLFAALFAISLAAGWGNDSCPTGQVVANNNGVQPTAEQPTNNPTLNPGIVDSDPVLGDANAKITVVEYSDFQCPFCERAATGTVAGLKNSQMFKDGEVNFIYKHFPLESIHPEARPSAIASVCAQEQGKFWEYHDILFENQNSLNNQNYIKWAGDLGLNTEEFTSCLSSAEANNKVSADLTAATNAGGRGTPYFIVVNNDNGKTTAVSGAVPYANLEAAINQVK